MGKRVRCDARSLRVGRERAEQRDREAGRIPIAANQPVQICDHDVAVAPDVVPGALADGLTDWQHQHLRYATT